MSPVIGFVRMVDTSTVGCVGGLPVGVIEIDADGD
jgi:hypothetical protein